MDTLGGGVLVLAGVALGLLVDLLRDERKARADKAAKRFDVEYDSLAALGDLLPSFVGMQGADLRRSGRGSRGH
jgi:hypothetical protein